MRKKYLLGIGLPLLVLVGILILEIGFNNVKVSTPEVNRVDFNRVFLDYKSKDTRVVTIQIITLENYFFLPSSYQIPKFTACLYDLDNESRRSERLDIMYMSARQETSKNYRDRLYSDQVIEIPVNSRKLIYIMAIPKKLSDFENKSVYYKEFEEIVLFETKDYPKNSHCGVLREDILDHSYRIEIK